MKMEKTVVANELFFAFLCWPVNSENKFKLLLGDFASILVLADNLPFIMFAVNVLHCFSTTFNDMHDLFCTVYSYY